MKKIIVYAAIFIVAISPLFRGMFFAFETNILLAVMALLAIAYFLIKLSRMEEVRVNKWLFLSGAFLLVSYIIAFVDAVSVRDNINALILFTEYFVLSIILFDYFHDKKQQFGWAVMVAISLSGLLNAIIGIEAISGYFKPLENTINSDRLGGTFQYANTAAIYFVICLIFALSIINASKKLLTRVIFYGLGNMALLATLLTASRGGYLIGFPVLLVFILIQPAKHKLRAFGSLICMSIPTLIYVSRISAQRGTGDFIQLNKWLLLSIFMAIILGVLYEMLKILLSRTKAKAIWGIATMAVILVSLTAVVINKGFAAFLPDRILTRFIDLARDGFNDFNVYIRLEFDKWALKLISENWFIGRGGGAWDSLYQSVQGVFFSARNTHNNYLQIFIESGILGFVSYLAVIVISLWYALYSLIRTKNILNKIQLAGISCGFLALTLHSAVDFDLTFVSISFLFWMFISASAVFAHNENEELNRRIEVVIKNKITQYAMIIICSVLLSLNGLYSVSSYFAEKGYNKMAEGDIQAAQACYIEANSLDGINPVYIFQLTKIYKYYADISTDSEESYKWSQMARVEAEKCVAINNFYPEYRDILLRIYFDSGMVLNALDSAERLVKLQPQNNANYGLLARAYFESADYYIKKQDIGKAKELLELCSQINDLPGAKSDESIANYKKQAIDELKKY